MKQIINSKQQMDSFFDYMLHSEMQLPTVNVDNLAALLFTKLEHRREDSCIIISHSGPQIVTVSLDRLRYIVYSLFRKFSKAGIKPGSTVLLASLPGNNELFIALMFLALSCYGIRVLLPMFMETNEMAEWIRSCKCESMIIPSQEISSLSHHGKEKDVLQSVRHIALQEKLHIYDLQKDFQIDQLLFNTYPAINYLQEPIIKNAIAHTFMDTEALMITTSGSSGKSKILNYEQGAFILSCLSWQKAGFYEKEIMGSCGFTPLFNHTMGVRAFFNSLWTGEPVCFIISDWFLEKPETVRFFLMKMQPKHITGGPAIYSLLLELMRSFPELKLHLRPHLKTLICSGAPLNSNTTHELESAFGVSVHNAYGTTETQQVLSTLLIDSPGEGKLKTLGLPLPGVSVGLLKLNDKKDQYKLFVKSPFGCSRYQQDSHKNLIPDGFFDTGDIVRLENKNEIYYVAREGSDFFKDQFGVKIPIDLLRDYYAKLHVKSLHVEYFPQQNQPGLSALIFINESCLPKGLIRDQSVINKFNGLLLELGIKLYNKTEPFEFWHRHINRFLLINNYPPQTGKGTVIRHKILEDYEDIIRKLVNPFLADVAVKNIDIHASLSDSFTRFHNPLLGQMLSAVGLDYTFHKAKKDTLYTFIDGVETEILDFTGGYGSNLIGHNNTQIIKLIHSFLRNNEISLSDQGSIQKYSGLLAEELNLIIGGITGNAYNVLFGSSGSEAVEIALHHALFEWKSNFKKMMDKQYRLFGRYVPELLEDIWLQNNSVIDKAIVHVIVSNNAYHGNSSGARALLGNSEKRKPFLNLLSVKPLQIDDRLYDWQIQLEKMLNKSKIQVKIITSQDGEYRVKYMSISTVIAAIFEPVIGEGGIREIDQGVLQHIQQYPFPLIMDEIQCGLGRSGKFLASEGINADYYLLGKSLGGGTEKISAVLINKNRYQDDFGKFYLSTFANGGMAAKTALEVLKIIKKENLPEKIMRKGQHFIKKLKMVQAKYPGVINKISGKGLMLGIQFCDFRTDDSLFLRILQEKKILGYLFSTYLLKQYKIRVLPTLSASDTLRIEPSAYISNKEVDLFINALENLSCAIENRQIYHILQSLMDNDPFTDRNNFIPELGRIPTKIEKPKKSAVSIAFIIHFAYPLDELRMLESTLLDASDTGLRILLNRIQVLMEMQPLTLFAQNICNNQINLQTILIPIDSAEMERLYRRNETRKIITHIQAAVDMAAKNGAKVISLGGYTSIMSNNGNLIAEPKNTKLITGNTLTAALGLKKLVIEIERFHEFGKPNVLAIVGASGNIGTIITKSLIFKNKFFNKIYLIGKNRNRLEKLVENLLSDKIISNEIQVEIATDLSSLKKSNMIISMTNTNDPIIFTHHLSKDYPVFISDVSIPSAIAPEVKKMNNVTVLPFSSYVSLPDDPDFVLSSCSPAGTVVCCAGEAILCGLESANISLKGSITAEGIKKITHLAEKYNFFTKLGQVKSFKATA